MKKILNIVILILLITIWGCGGSDNESLAQNKTAKTEKISQNKPVWMKFDEGIKKGVNEKKNMLVDFYTDWCHWCKVMDEKTFNDPKVAKKLADRFSTIRIDAESNTERAHFAGQEFTHAQLTQAFRVTGFPSLAFISPEQEIITVIPGYIPAEQFYYILEYIDQECYKRQMPFDEFMKRKGKCDTTKKVTP